MNSKPCILIVEDNQQNLKYLGDLLSEEGYQLSIATNAQQTYSILKVIQPDLILLDIMLPQTDGYQICQTIKKNPHLSHIPILFNSALFSVEDKIKAFNAGASDYISKPFYSEEILKRIEVHLKYSQTISPTQSTPSPFINLHLSINNTLSAIESYSPQLNDPIMELKLNGIAQELRSTLNTIKIGS
ncbi:MAG: response regulator [Fibrobacterales bacterium]